LKLPKSTIALLSALVFANIAAWLWAYTLFAERPLVLGTALLAWIFGLRHAVDADHIAAIDNVVRKLMQQGRPAHTVGFFFSFGHSTVVVVAVVLLALTATAFRNEFESFKTIGGLIGTSVSAFFLLVIALVNAIIFANVWNSFRRVSRGGTLDHEGLDQLLAGRGLLARMLRPVFGLVTHPWHMYPLGLLFGLGFDTATEVGLLSISASEAANGMSYSQIVVFPALFTAGMALVDTLDSTLMSGAYSWAFVNPIRKLWYNLSITAASIVVAVFIGSVEALGLIAARLSLEGSFWQVIAELNESLAGFGFFVVGLFSMVWLASMLVYRLRGYDRLGSPATAR
jgi:nickel/cobalt transporter (NiCoT) family protein